MPISNESRLVGFDAEAAAQAALDAVEGTLFSFVEYTVRDFNPVYVADETSAMYESREQMAAHFKQIHTHVHMDLMEIDTLVENLFPIADRVSHIVTSLDYLQLLRVYADEEAVFLALGPDEPLDPVVRAVEPYVQGEK